MKPLITLLPAPTVSVPLPVLVKVPAVVKFAPPLKVNLPEEELLANPAGPFAPVWLTICGLLPLRMMLAAFVTMFRAGKLRSAGDVVNTGGEVVPLKLVRVRWGRLIPANGRMIG